MLLRKLTIEDFDEVLKLFHNIFREDKFYLSKYGTQENLDKCMIKDFYTSLKYCIESDMSCGVFDDNNELVAFKLNFDYFELKNNTEEFNKMFGVENGELPYKDEIHSRINKLKPNVLYMVAMGVKKQLRRNKLATAMTDYIIKTYTEHNLVCDISNSAFLSYYKNNNFKIYEIEENYWFAMLVR